MIEPPRPPSMIFCAHDGVPGAAHVDVHDIAEVFWRDGVPCLGSGDTGALIGHPHRMRAALTPCRTGDEGHLAREPSGHFCAAFTRFDPMISRWISLVPSYSRSSRTSR